MAFTPLTALAFKAVATSARINQIVENIVTHDHRGDGSQGAPLIGAWVNATGLTAAAGWSITGTPRYRLLPGLIAVDLVMTRTGVGIGGTLESSGTTAPGNVADQAILTGWPAPARPSKAQPVVGTVSTTNPATVRFLTDGTVQLIYTNGGGVIGANDVVTLTGVLWA